MTKQHKDKLQALYTVALNGNLHLPSNIERQVKFVAANIEKQTAVFTALITLGIHKILHPEQDIRNHQKSLPGGFSARGIDTASITPTLMELELPGMKETAWLTRSLEQTHPYTKDYPGKIQTGKQEFLEIVDFIENNQTEIESVIMYLLYAANQIKINNSVPITPLTDPESLTVASIIADIEKLLNHNYSIAGISKAPVIVLYTAYEIIVQEVERYKNKTLKELASHTSPDSRAKAAGDIEIFDQNQLFEAIEIKHNIGIDLKIMRRVIEKIHEYNPKRYYILSTVTTNSEKIKEITKIIAEVRHEHGCQIIINGVIPTIKYYLRLINDLKQFYEKLSENIINDSELKIEHKNMWREISQKH